MREAPHLQYGGVEMIFFLEEILRPYIQSTKKTDKKKGWLKVIAAVKENEAG